MFNAQTVSNVGFDSNVYQGAWCEDYYRTEYAYKVQIELVDGRRFYLDRSVLTSEDLDYADIEKIQLARILKIERHLAAGGELNADHWYETDPAYGSLAYDRLDSEGHFKALERKEFELNGI